MELSGQKRVKIGQKRAKRSVYHLKNVNSVLRDVEVASSNLVTSTIITKKRTLSSFLFVICFVNDNT